MEKPREDNWLNRTRAKLRNRFFQKLSEATNGQDLPDEYLWGRSNTTEFSHRTLLGLTRDKVVYFSPGFFRRKLISLPYEHILTVDESATLTTRRIILYFLNAGLVFFPVQPLTDPEVKQFLDTLRSRMSAGGKASVAATPTTPDITDQIRKLSELVKDGILSEAEFEAKKKELLARM